MIVQNALGQPESLLRELDALNLRTLRHCSRTLTLLVIEYALVGAVVIVAWRRRVHRLG